MKFDDILLEIGEFGPYQKRVFYLLCLPVIVAAAQLFSAVFTYNIPAYRCALPDYPSDTYKIQNEAHASLVNELIPPAGAEDDDGLYSGCQFYSSRNDSLMSALNTNETEECQRRVFDKSYFQNTVITEFDLVCGKEIMRSHSNMMNFVGELCGSVLMGVFADVYGRKKAIMFSLVIEVLYSGITFFAKSFYIIMLSRIIGGIAIQALFAIPLATGIELVGPNKRSYTGVFVQFYWCTGQLLMLPVTYVLRQWRYTHLAITVVALPMVSLWWLIPESPRWLLEKRRYKEVEVTLAKICKANKRQLPEGAISDETNDEGPQVKLSAIFTHKTLILRSLIIFFNWLAVNLLYYGLSLNTINLEGSPYLNYFLNGMVELMSTVFCLILIERIGRRTFHCSCMALSTLACLAVIVTILLNSHGWPRMAFALAGKFSSSCASTILYILSAEQFPTVVRSSAFGFCSVFEGLGGMFAPYIADLGILVGGSFGQGIPMAVFAGLSLFAGVLSLLLPETLHRKLPETIQDAIEMGKHSKASKNSTHEVNDPETYVCLQPPHNEEHDVLPDGDNSKWNKKPGREMIYENNELENLSHQEEHIKSNNSSSPQKITDTTLTHHLPEDNLTYINMNPILDVIPPLSSNVYDDTMDDEDGEGYMIPLSHWR